MDKKRRMSILKPSALRVDVNEAESTKPTNKVRFSSNFVKEFATMAEGEYHTIWNNTYEEEIAKSSSHSSLSMASNSTSSQAQAREDELVKENTRHNCFFPKFGREKENMPIGNVHYQLQLTGREPGKVLSDMTIQKDTTGYNEVTNSQIIQSHCNTIGAICKPKLQQTILFNDIENNDMDITGCSQAPVENMSIGSPLKTTANMFQQKIRATINFQDSGPNENMDITNSAAVNEENHRKRLLFAAIMDETFLETGYSTQGKPVVVGEDSIFKMKSRHTVHFNTSNDGNMDITNISLDECLGQVEKSFANTAVSNININMMENKNKRTILLPSPMDETILDSPHLKTQAVDENSTFKAMSRQTLHFKTTNEGNMDITNIAPDECFGQIEKSFANTAVSNSNVNIKENKDRRTILLPSPMDETILEWYPLKFQAVSENFTFKTKSRRTVHFNTSNDGNMDFTSVSSDECLEQMEESFANTAVSNVNINMKENKDKRTILFPSPMDETILECLPLKSQAVSENCTFKAKSRQTVHFNTSNDGNMDITNIAPDECLEQMEELFANTAVSNININMKENKDRRTILLPSSMDETMLASPHLKTQAVGENSTFKAKSRQTVHFNTSNDGNMDITNVGPDQCPEKCKMPAISRRTVFFNASEDGIMNITNEAQIELPDQQAKGRKTILLATTMEETIPHSGSMTVPELSHAKSRRTAHFNVAEDGAMDITNCSAGICIDTALNSTIIPDKNRKTALFAIPVKETILDSSLKKIQEVESTFEQKIGAILNFNAAEEGEVAIIAPKNFHELNEKDSIKQKGSPTMHFNALDKCNMDMSIVSHEENNDHLDQIKLTSCNSITKDNKNRKTIISSVPVEAIPLHSASSRLLENIREKSRETLNFNSSKSGKKDLTISQSLPPQKIFEFPTKTLYSIPAALEVDSIRKMQAFDILMEETMMNISQSQYDDTTKKDIINIPENRPAISEFMNVSMESDYNSPIESKRSLYDVDLEEIYQKKEEKKALVEFLSGKDANSMTVTNKGVIEDDRININNQKRTIIPTVVITDFDCSTYSKELTNNSIENLHSPSLDLKNVSAIAKEKDDSVNEKNHSDLLDFAAHDSVLIDDFDSSGNSIQEVSTLFKTLPSAQPKLPALINLEYSDSDESDIVEESMDMEQFKISIENIPSMDVKNLINVEMPHTNIESFVSPIQNWVAWAEQERHKKLKELEELESFVVDEATVIKRTLLQKAEKLAIRQSEYTFDVLSEDSVRLFIFLGELEMIVYMDPHTGSVLSFDLGLICLDQKSNIYLKWLDKFLHHIMDARHIQSCIGRDIGILSLMEYVEYQMGEFRKTFNSVFKSYIWYKASLNNDYRLDYRHLSVNLDVEVQLDLGVFKMEKVVVEPVVHRGLVCRKKLLQIIEAVTRDADFPLNVLSEIDKYLKESSK